MESNVFLGVALHAIGGLAASTCFVPQKGTPNWSYQSFWLLMCLASWLLMPIGVAFLTVPDLVDVIKESPNDVLVNTTLLGAVYGFGGMAFGLAIRYIGFSLTYSIAIGISAILGTVVPGILNGNLIANFQKPGGLLVLAGLTVSLLGVAFCGLAGFRKEKEVSKEGSTFDAKKGTVIVILAGILSAVFGISLEQGAPIDAIAEAKGAGNFQGNAKFIFAMGGAFITNLIWWSVVHFRAKTWKEYTKVPQSTDGKSGSLPTYLFFGLLAGVLWYCQFFFYGLGHVQMGAFKFISWGIHMSMLIFFSFGIGLILKEWSGLSKKVTNTLLVGLAVLLGAFGLITYGSYIGENSGTEATSNGH